MTHRRTLEPLKGLARAAGQCATQAEQYGQCMLANYQEIRRDACAAEFRAFKACVEKQVCDQARRHAR